MFRQSHGQVFIFNFKDFIIYIYDLESICNDPNEMKEKWQNFCPEHQQSFTSPKQFYQKIGNPNWNEAKVCSLEPTV